MADTGRGVSAEDVEPGADGVGRQHVIRVCVGIGTEEYVKGVFGEDGSIALGESGLDRAFGGIGEFKGDVEIVLIKGYVGDRLVGDELGLVLRNESGGSGGAIPLAGGDDAVNRRKFGDEGNRQYGMVRHLVAARAEDVEFVNGELSGDPAVAHPCAQLHPEVRGIGGNGTEEAVPGLGGALLAVAPELQVASPAQRDVVPFVLLPRGPEGLVEHDLSLRIADIDTDALQH